MKLSNFIRSNIEEISIEWEKFAATLLPEEKFSAFILRNGITSILNDIAIDMDHYQSAEQQKEKSIGEKISLPHTDSVAEEHALKRVNMGLSLLQLISEFRALRATVIRLWQQHEQAVETLDTYDITRFNEAIDQMLTKTVERYSETVEQSRELFLGILGHDLRTPLGAISGLAELLLQAKTPDRIAIFSAQILTCTKRMSHMITDLIELTRVQLGTGISVNPSRMDMQKFCSQALEEMKAMYPEKVFQLDSENDLLGEWDEPRMSQVLSNLLGNAVQHGTPDTAVTVIAKKVNEGIEIHVHNEGATISPEMQQKIFDRFVQGQSGKIDDEGGSTSLGLGLYIAKEIIVAHGGTIHVHSRDGEGTTFVLCLPLTK